MPTHQPAIVHLRAWGDLACFTRPEMKVERVSYPVMTPSAARGLLEAILFRPQFRWAIRRIAVRQPIRFLGFRRNEVKSRLSPKRPSILWADEDRTQRNTLALRDVEYVIEAGIQLTALANQARRRPPSGEDDGPDTPAKYLAMFQRRVARGQCFAQPYFGCREFPASFAPARPADMDPGPLSPPDADLGIMVFDIFSLAPPRSQPPGRLPANPHLTVFHATLAGGNLVASGSPTLPTWDEIGSQLGASQ